MSTSSTSNGNKNTRMAAIRGKDTKPETFVRKLLFSHGYRYRKNARTLPGHPDIWMRKHNTVIFVNGCFWHRHEGCKFAYKPKSNSEFWRKKFENNVQRDAENKKRYLEKGIKCLIIWECTINECKTEAEREELLSEIESFFRSPEPYLEI